MGKKAKIIKIGIIGVLFIVNIILLGMFNSSTTTYLSLKVVFADSEQAVESVEVVSKNVVVGRTDENGNVVLPTDQLDDEIAFVSSNTYSSSLKVSDINQSESIKLLKKGFNYIYGKISSTGNVSDVVATLDNQDFKVDTDGSFVLTTAKTGDLTVKFQSDNFQEVLGVVNVTSGINNLSVPINLKHSGSLFFKNESYIGKLPVSDIRIEAESLNEKFIRYTTNETKLTNLIPGKEYFIRITGKDVNTREYLFEAPNVSTPFGEVRLVERGYFPVVTREGNVTTLALKDLDGKFYKTVSEGNNLRILNAHMNNDSGKLYFRSNELGRSSSYPVFEYDIATSTKTTVTQSNSQLFTNTVALSYSADSVVVGARNSDGTKLVLYNLKGDFIKDLHSTTNTETIAKILIPTNGSAIFVQIDGRSSSNRIIGINPDGSISDVASGNIELLAVDSEGENIVYLLNDSRDTIHNYKYSQRLDAELDIRVIGEDFQFDTKDNNVLYFMMNDIQIIKYTFDNNFAQEFILFDRLNTFDSIVQEGNFMFTIKDEKVNVFNKNLPTNFKLLNNN